MSSIIPQCNEKAVFEIYRDSHRMIEDIFLDLTSNKSDCEVEAILCDIIKQSRLDVKFLDEKIESMGADKFRQPSRDDLLIYVQIVYSALYWFNVCAEKEDGNGMWYYLLHAQKWLAVLEYILKNEWLMQQSLKKIGAQKARKGGLAKNKKYQPIKDALHKILRDSVEKDGKPWPSAYVAASKLQDQALEIASSYGIELTESSLPTTLQTWFNAFEDRNTLFASRLRRSASKPTS